jgi:flagellar hook assembly protein FlgD
MPPPLGVEKVGKPDAGATAEGGGNNNKKAGGNGNNTTTTTKSLIGAPTATAAATAAGGGRGPHNDKHPVKRPTAMVVVHDARCTTPGATMPRSAEKSRSSQQLCQEGAPSRQWDGKQKVDPEVKKEEKIETHNAKRALKAVYDHSDSNSSVTRRSTSCMGAPGTSYLGVL